jgi:hypothetical protein
VCWVDLCHDLLSLSSATDQNEPAGVYEARVHGIQAITMCFKHRSRSIERLGQSTEITHRERDFRFGQYTSRAGQGIVRVEGARRSLQKILRSREVAKLRHGDSAKRKPLRIVAQGDQIQSG